MRCGGFSLPRLSRLVGVLCLLGIAPCCIHTMKSTRPDRILFADAFVPSVEGKKLLHYRGPSYEYMRDHTEEMERVPFDGLIIGGLRPFYINEKPYDFDGFVARMREIPFQRYTDNFYLCYAGVDAVEQTDFDWFHDLTWVADNWRKMARAAKEAGFKGICFDSEHYGGKPLFGYRQMKYRESKTFEEYQAQVRLRGAEIMRAVSEVYPDITILFLFGYSGSFCGVPQHPKENAEAYTLVSAFVDGMLSACGPQATIHDMHEQSFSLREPGSYARVRRMMTDVLARKSHNPEHYRRNHRAGFSFWADCWGDDSKGRSFDIVDFERNYYTPDEFAWSLHQALAYSDKYVWMWPGAFRWWEGKVGTVNADGQTIEAELPQAYLDALSRARDPNLPAPARDRKPNFYRVDSAKEWKGWSDEEAFGDLWSEYVLLADLPVSWRFRLDPDEVGWDQAWYSREIDDSDWAHVRIREFWEKQGYSPYDGCAWYRVRFVPPALPRGKAVLLAFGAIADEAQIFVNGKLVFASEPGENIRHQRLLVDVTRRLRRDVENLIAVRVWNTSWCGGIWKNVKLIAQR